MQVWQRHNAALFSFSSYAARRMKLGLAEVAALEQIALRGRMTPGELGQSLAMPSATITALLDRLEYKKMIRRQPNPNDRRGLLIEMTPHAFEKAGADLMPLGTAISDILAAMSQQDRSTVEGFLSQVTALMISHSGPQKPKSHIN
jgi:DNA-binding MarR family transcriptional regulator